MKILKKKRKKYGLGIWWRGSCPQNLAAWIYAEVSGKLEFTHDGRRRRTPDACAITVALLTKSSRAKKLTEGLTNLIATIEPTPTTISITPWRASVYYSSFIFWNRCVTQCSGYFPCRVRPAAFAALPKSASFILWPRLLPSAGWVAERRRGDVTAPWWELSRPRRALAGIHCKLCNRCV